MNSIFFLSTMNGAAWGGSEELWYRTALHALNQGRKVGVAVYNWADKEAKLKQLESAGATIYRLPNAGVRKKNLPEKLQDKFNRKILLPGAINNLPFSEYDVTVFNLGEFENTHKAWKHVYKKAGRYVVLFHNYNESQVLKPEKADILQKWMDHAKLNLFASKRIEEVLHANSGVIVRNGEILLNPITFSPPTAPIAFPPLQQGNYVWVMLAALEVNRKSQDHLIMALASDKWKQRNWSLHLYGQGRDMELLAALIKTNSLSDKIHLEGHTSDPQAVITNAHLLLQITKQDAMPLSVVEAMAIGRPVAVSRIGDMPHWVSESVNGWISADASVSEIDKTLERAWQQKDQWQAYGERSFEIFRKKYPSSVEEKLLEQIDRAVG